MTGKRVVIAGAAGRDFHNFNLVYRGREEFEVVAFTATQIPNIEGRVYPATLAGELYPEGISIVAEEKLETLIAEHEAEEVVFAYSDVTHEHVMHVGSRALAAGASYRLLSPRETMLTSSKPVVAVCAVRTGSGKSQTTRYLAGLLREAGKRVAVLRHPMPYGDLSKQAVQRFASYDDLDAADCTIEEREEYEPHLNDGNLVFAGIDYAAILDAAEQEADVILWDGGNNDSPFISRTCSSSSSTPTGLATNFATTRARPTSAWPTSASSTRSIPPRRQASRRCSRRSARRIRGRESCARHRRFRSRATRPRSPASGCSRSRTGRH
jgi:predicted GTPase